MTNCQTPEGKDAELWKLAQARSSFKSHLSTYLVMSLFFWIIWYFSGGTTYNRGIPWPVWPMFGWGIGVFFHYLGAYVRPGQNNVEKEYQKLVQQQNKH